MPSPRIFKSHLPAFLLPKELWTVRPKIIYTARNRKDIAVSLYHFPNALNKSTLSLEEIFDAFLSELLLMSPLHAHVLSFWELRILDHLLFIRYEDLLADQFTGVKKISSFLECSFSDQEIANLVDHVSFKKMKDRIFMTTLHGSASETKFINYLINLLCLILRFCRKGKAGAYRDEMSDEYIKRFDEWTADRLRNTDFSYADV